MSEIVLPIDVGVVPEAAVSAPVLLQSDQSTFVIFNAMTTTREQNELAEAGRAICEFPGCSITKFGYPNDEAWAAIPRTHGLAYGIFEIANSEWDQEIAALNKYAFPNSALRQQRHFLILFHDSTFECLANNIQCETSSEPMGVILSRLAGQVAAE